MELLRAKELELMTVKRQVEALRIALPLLGEEGDSRTSAAAYRDAAMREPGN
jgi:hypothetical protein